MKVFDYKCDKCEHEEIDKLVDNSDEVVPCSQCEHPKMTRQFNSIGRINIKGICYKGDASKVDRFEMISKGVEDIDLKASKREGKTILKDSK